MSRIPTPTETGVEPRRSGWRQRLVDIERGLTFGLRSDSTLYGDLFLALLLVAIGSVLKLSDPQWIVLTMALTWLLVTELLQQALSTVSKGLAPLLPRADLDQARKLAAAAVGVAFTGGGIVVVLVFVQRFRELLGE